MTEGEMFAWAMVAWVAMMIVTLLCAVLQMTFVAPRSEAGDAQTPSPAPHPDNSHDPD